MGRISSPRHLHHLQLPPEAESESSHSSTNSLSEKGLAMRMQVQDTSLAPEFQTACLVMPHLYKNAGASGKGIGAYLTEKGSIERGGTRDITSGKAPGHQWTACVGLLFRTWVVQLAELSPKSRLSTSS